MAHYHEASPACLAKKINKAGAFCGLKKLHGEDLDIIRANDIRGLFMANFREIRVHAESKNAPDLMRIIEAYFCAILAQDSPEWIANRANYDSPRAILRDMNDFAKRMQLI